MGEANAYFAGWKSHPPVYILVKSLLEGLGGKPAEDTISDSDISTLGREVGSALPIIRGRDPGLPSSPVFDLDEMRRRNLAHKIGEKSRAG